MARLLVHITVGPHDPTKVALGLLVARTALDGGHEVDVFFAGDAVAVLRPSTLAAGHGVGTGSLEEHVNALVGGGARIHASRMSSNARGLGAGDVGDVPVGFATPDMLVRLTFEADRVLCY
ncbi:MAG TPA: DsrE family protein [Candidatus Limnocylindrales bacterium]|nr:DsrE family protein [Candidatus Limnocylindrales bacterium]